MEPITNIPQGQQDAVSLFEKFAGCLAAKRPKKTQPFFLSLILGALLAIARRRTVTPWIKAAKACDDFRKVFYHIPNIGCKGDEIFDAMTGIIIEQLKPVIATAGTICLVVGFRFSVMDWRRDDGKALRLAFYHSKTCAGDARCPGGRF